MKPVLLVQENNESDSDTFDFAAAELDGELVILSQDKSLLFSKWKKNKGGKVEVIAVPFIKGSHVCRNAQQALFLWKNMKQFHKKGLVHGDISGLNIVFQEEDSNNEAYFMDHDFGGHVEIDKPVYPPAYQERLPDGHRAIMMSRRSNITAEHDVRALAYVLGWLHEPQGGKFTDELKILYMDLLKAADEVTMEVTLKKLNTRGPSISPSDEYNFFLNARLTNATATIRHGNNKATPPDQSVA